jgi:hypothetical protein
VSLFSLGNDCSDFFMQHKFFLPLHRVENGNNNDYVDPEGHDSHEEYLAAFKRTLIEKLRVCIDKDLKYDPDGGKG